MTPKQLVFSMGQHYLKTVVKSRRSLIAAVLYLLTLVFLVVGAVNNAADGPQALALYGSFQFLGPLGFLVQFFGLFYGIAVISEELENGTLPFLLVRPVPRWTFVLGRACAAFLFILCALTVMNAILLVLVRPDPLLPSLVASQIALVLGALVYVSLFTAISTVVKKPLAPALLFLVLWEFGLSLVPLKARYVTVKFHLMSLYRGLSGTEAGGGVAEQFFARCDLAPSTSIVVLCLTSAGALWIALARFKRMQI